MTKNRIIPALILLGLLLLLVACHRRLSLQDFCFPGGERISIVNNPAAEDVTYDELLKFLSDYQWPTTGTITCGTVAKDLHDKAELAGIKAGIGIVQLPSTWHGFNVFDATDAGFIYVDASWGGILIIRKSSSTFQFYQIFNGEVVQISPWGVLADPLLEGHEQDINIFW